MATAPVNQEDSYLAFQAAVEKALGDQVRADPDLACELWCAMSNQHWRHAGSMQIGYTFREAAVFVAEVRRQDRPDDAEAYMHWYNCGKVGVVSGRVGDALEEQGWFPCADDDG